jgi:anti-anti-sigma factor
VARQRLATPTKADGGSAIKSDSTISEAAPSNRCGNRSILVKLSGEFDVRCQKTLEDTLSGCLASGRPTVVDLSDVTFMDSRCLEELVIVYQLGKGRVALCDPSQEVAWRCATWRSGSISSIRPASGDPPGYTAASVFRKAAIRPKKGALTHAHTVHGGKS